MQKIKKGDEVEVLTGRDKGKRGKVLEVDLKERQVMVEGVFVQKRHMKPGANQRFPNGGIVDKPGRISISNVMFFSQKLGRAVRVGILTKEDGRKVRVARGRNGQGIELD